MEKRGRKINFNFFKKLIFTLNAKKLRKLLDLKVVLQGFFSYYNGC